MKCVILALLLATTSSASAQIYYELVSKSDFKKTEEIAARISDPVRRVDAQIAIIYTIGPRLKKKGEATVSDYQKLLEYQRDAYADINVSKCSAEIKAAIEAHEHAISAALKFLSSVSNGTTLLRNLVLGDSTSNETWDDYIRKLRRTQEDEESEVETAMKADMHVTHEDNQLGGDVNEFEKQAMLAFGASYE